MILSVVMCTAHLLMALPLEWTGVGGFYTGVFVAAGSFGGTFPLTVVITSELFGLKHHGEMSHRHFQFDTHKRTLFANN